MLKRPCFQLTRFPCTKIVDVHLDGRIDSAGAKRQAGGNDRLPERVARVALEAGER